VSKVTLARNRSLGRLESSTARLPRGQQNWSGLRFFLSSSWCLPPSYGCGGCRILRARTVDQYVESAVLEKTTAAPSAIKGVRNDRRARSSSKLKDASSSAASYFCASSCLMSAASCGGMGLARASY
jgi:hypothetical protein